MATGELLHGEITNDILHAFFRVHSLLGFGYLESAYSAAMARTLSGFGRRVAREFVVEVIYEGVPIATHRLDMVVDERVVVEIKASAVLHPIGERQLFNYLRSTNLEVGLLLHLGPKARFKRLFVSRASKSPPTQPPPPRS